MNKKLFLTSMLVLGFMTSAFATQESNEFPSDGLMQEDFIYTNAATYDNMGVYEGTVYANPMYNDVLYTVGPGVYLPAGGEAVENCLPGNFCPGLQNQVTYNETTDQGLETCPQDFGLSARGSTANTNCYRACDIQNMGGAGSIANIAHATTLAGKDYYGEGVDTCEATACAPGYYIQSSNSNPSTIIGTTTAADYGWSSNDGSDDYHTSVYDITNNGEFVVDYGNQGKIHGYARCSTRGVANIWYENSNVFEDDHFVATLPNSGGRYCYCMLDGYTPLNGSFQNLSSSWVFSSDKDDAVSCAVDCAEDCTSEGLASNFTEGLAFRAAVFDTIQVAGVCQANTINIDWRGTTQQAIDDNNAGTCQYDGNINTPVSATHVPGKTFLGWRFSTTQD